MKELFKHYYRYHRQGNDNNSWKSLNKPWKSSLNFEIDFQAGKCLRNRDFNPKLHHEITQGRLKYLKF